MDFEKAFDKVPHKQLIRELRSCGVREDLIEWIKGFLVQRRQQVTLNLEYSSVVPLTSDIPQGSVCLRLFVIIIHRVRKQFVIIVIIISGFIVRLL